MMDRVVLSNGFEIYIHEIDSARTVTVSVVIRAGSYDETNRYGVAHFLEHAVFKGTKTRNYRQIMEAVDGVGGEINAETSFESTRYYVTVPAESWRVGTDVLLDVVLNSTLPPDEIDLERRVIQEELKTYTDVPESRVVDNLLEAMHKGYPNRRWVGGTVQSVSKITRDDLLEFKDRFYQPRNMYAVVTGRFDRDEIVDFISSTVGKVDNLSESVPRRDTFKPDILDFNTIVVKKGTEQAHLAWGLFGAAATDPDAFSLELAVTVLGSGSSSRLFQLLREQRGLCYDVSLDYTRLSDTGLIIGYVGLRSDNVDKVRDVIVDEFERLRIDPIDDTEFERAVSHLRGRMILRSENPSFINSYVSNAIILNVSTDPNDYLNRIESVSVQDVLHVARRYFIPDNWQFSLIL